MSGILLTLLGAFSFLMPHGGMIVSNMGFMGYNPARINGNRMMVMGRLGTLDSKEAVLEVSSGKSYFRAVYKSFGKLEVRGEVPQDGEFISSYPYLFMMEAGGNIPLSPNFRAGASILFFEQRLMTEDLRGYALSLGAEYLYSKVSIDGYVRNIGPRAGYMASEKYGLPVTGSVSLTYRQKENLVSLSVNMPNVTPSESTIFLGYLRKISKTISLGGEVAFENDLSFGYRTTYPLRFMLRAKKNRLLVGYLVEIPVSGFNLRNSLYLGVGI